MNLLRYPLGDGMYINRVLVTEPLAEPRHFDRVPLPGKVNEWLSKGFSIHENPFRRWFAADRRGRKPPAPALEGGSPGALPAAGMFLDAGDSRFGPLAPYFPFGNVNVDKSAFYYEPTALRRYGCFFIDSPGEVEVEIQLWTCGAVTMWKDGRELVDFAPFTRNMVKRTAFRVFLAARFNLFYLCHDDLAERDTDYYFRIAMRPAEGSWNVGDEPSILLPLPDSCDANEVAATEKALGALHTPGECLNPRAIALSSSAYPITNIGDTLDSAVVPKAPSLALSYRYIAGEGLGQAPGSKPAAMGTFDAAARGEHLLIPYDGDQPTLLRIVVWREIGGIKLEKVIGVLVAGEGGADAGSLGARVAPGGPPGSVAERASAALAHLASSGSDDVYAALARVAASAGPAGDRDEKAFFAALDKADARHDCADFSLVAVIHAYLEFGARLSPALRKRALDTLAGFRYWCDEPGDDVMWFFSENHALLFHSCELFAGTILPYRVFPNSGLTGQQHRRKALDLLDAWFERFFAESITEWNSSAYIPVDVHGLAALYKLCDVPEVRIKAKGALDMLFRTLALYAFDGVVAGSFGRSYEKELRGNLAAGTTPLLWVGFGVGRLNTAGLGLTELCLSGYEPPPGLAWIAELGAGGQGKAAAGRPPVLCFRNTQGWERHVDCCLYKTAGALLSSAVDFRPGRPGYQEHVLHAALSASAQCWINHPGETRPGGGGRPSYWAGNGVLPKVSQYRNIAVAIWNGSKDPDFDIVARWTHAYLPLMEFDEYIVRADSIALRKGGSFLGIRAANGIAIVTEDETAGKEVRSQGLRNAWLVLVEGSGSFPDLPAFIDYFDGLGFEFDGSSVNPVASLSVADYGPLLFPWEGDPILAGAPIPKGSSDPEGVIES